MFTTGVVTISLSVTRLDFSTGFVRIALLSMNLAFICSVHILVTFEAEVRKVPSSSDVDR